jgi:hypothetical protein
MKTVTPYQSYEDGQDLPYTMGPDQLKKTSINFHNQTEHPSFFHPFCPNQHSDDSIQSRAIGQEADDYGTPRQLHLLFSLFSGGESNKTSGMTK